MIMMNHIVLRDYGKMTAIVPLLGPSASRYGSIHLSDPSGELRREFSVRKMEPKDGVTEYKSTGISLVPFQAENEEVTVIYLPVGPGLINEETDGADHFMALPRVEAQLRDIDTHSVKVFIAGLGVGGGYDPSYRAGDMLFPGNFIYSSELSKRLGIPPNTRYKNSAHLRLRDILFDGFRGTHGRGSNGEKRRRKKVESALTVLKSEVRGIGAEQRADHRKKLKCHCGDMESAGIQRFANTAGIPTTTILMVGDTISETPNFAGGEGRPKYTWSNVETENYWKAIDNIGRVFLEVARDEKHTSMWSKHF
jgi:hypothetical protein